MRRANCDDIKCERGKHENFEWKNKQTYKWSFFGYISLQSEKNNRILLAVFIMVKILLRRAKRAKKNHNLEIEFDQKDKYKGAQKGKTLKLNVKEQIRIKNFLLLAPLDIRRPSKKPLLGGWALPPPCHHATV